MLHYENTFEFIQQNIEQLCKEKSIEWKSHRLPPNSLYMKIKHSTIGKDGGYHQYTNKQLDEWIGVAAILHCMKSND